MPGPTPLEAYQPINEPTRPNQTFEGAFAWLVHSQAYAEDEWQKADPWNPPSSITLAAGATKTYALSFLLSDQVRHLEETLRENQRPVAVGIPGYVLPMDLDAHLFVNYRHKVKAHTVAPSGAITVHEISRLVAAGSPYTLRGNSWPSALTLTYDDTRSSRLATM